MSKLKTCVSIALLCASSLFLCACASTDRDLANHHEAGIPGTVINNDGKIAGVAFFESAPSDFQLSNYDSNNAFVRYYFKRNHMGYDRVYLGCSKGDQPIERPVYYMKLIKYVPKDKVGAVIGAKNSHAKKISQRLGVRHKVLSESKTSGCYYWQINSRQHYLENPEKYNKNCAISNYLTSVSLFWYEQEGADNGMLMIEVHTDKIKDLHKKNRASKDSQIAF